MSARHQNEDNSWLEESGQPRNRAEALEDMRLIMELKRGRFQTLAQQGAAHYEAFDQLLEVVLFLVKDTRK